MQAGYTSSRSVRDMVGEWKTGIVEEAIVEEARTKGGSFGRSGSVGEACTQSYGTCRDQRDLWHTERPSSLDG